MIENLYKVLGLSSSASLEEVKKSYRRLAREYHPDKNINGAEKFKEINDAYTILSDPDKKRDYILKNPSTSSASSSRSYGGYNFNFSFRYEQPRPSQPPPPPKPPKPKSKPKKSEYNIKTQCKLTLEDIYNGNKISVDYDEPIVCLKCNGDKQSDELKRFRTCDYCKGKGRTAVGHSCPYCGCVGHFVYWETCPLCKGNFKKIVKKTVRVHVPKGIHAGHSLEVKDRGQLMPNGKERGSIIIRTTELPHNLFKRQGDNLFVTVNLTLKEAIMGFTNKPLCTHLDGHMVTATQPCGNTTKPGSKKLIKGEGMPIFNSSAGSKGDLIVTFSVEFPDKVQVPRTRQERLVIDQLFETDEEKRARENAIVIDDEDDDDDIVAVSATKEAEKPSLKRKSSYRSDSTYSSPRVADERKKKRKVVDDLFTANTPSASSYLDDYLQNVYSHDTTPTNGTSTTTKSIPKEPSTRTSPEVLNTRSVPEDPNNRPVPSTRQTSRFGTTNESAQPSNDNTPITIDDDDDDDEYCSDRYEYQNQYRTDNESMNEKEDQLDEEYGKRTQDPPRPAQMNNATDGPSSDEFPSFFRMFF